jgi:PrtD family type I secretion system ABC transporter
MRTSPFQFPSSLFRRQQNEANKLRKFLFSYKRIIVFLFAFSGVMSFLAIVPSLYMFQIYDSVLASRNFDTLLMLTLIVVFMYALFGIIDWSRSQILIACSDDMDKKLKDKVFGAVLEKIIITGSTSPSRAFNDLTSLRQFLSGTGLFAFLDIPWMPIYIVIIFIIHPLLGIYSVVAGVVLLSIALINEYSTRKPLKESNGHYQSANSFLQANLRNTEVIEAMGMHSAIRTHWLEKYNPVTILQQKASKRASVFQSLTKACRICFQSLILGTGAYLAIQNIITAGEMIMASILMGRALSPIDSAVASWKNFVNVRESYQRLGELFNNYEENRPSVTLPAPTGIVSIEGIVVTPPNSNVPILRGITFSAAAGDLIAIIGPTAAGKTTLAKAIVGIWRTVAGFVRLDGAELSQYDREELGKHIGYLPQDIELFDGTIAENIARFGEIDSEKVIKATQITGVHDIILRLPQGYETPIGEAGNYLSGGQRQRIALARALYGEPPIILLDEPNSNLDEQGEAALMTALTAMRQLKKTIFVISHKTNILSIADKILVISNGTVFAFGPRDEILNKLIADKTIKAVQASAQQ